MTVLLGKGRIYWQTVVSWLVKINNRPITLKFSNLFLNCRYNEHHHHWYQRTPPLPPSLPFSNRPGSLTFATWTKEPLSSSRSIFHHHQSYCTPILISMSCVVNIVIIEQIVGNKPAEVFKVALDVTVTFIQICSCRAHYVLCWSLEYLDMIVTHWLKEKLKLGHTSLTRTSLSLLSSFEEE